MKKPSKKNKKLLQEADNQVRLAQKVLAYRKDILSDEAIDEIHQAAQAVGESIQSDDINEEQVIAQQKTLDKVLKKYGGSIYPVTFMSENIEMLLVAAILAIGIRSFFFQPFKIPTNSMYPTYAGMTYEVFHTEEEEPSLPAKIFRKIQLFTTNYNLKAEKSGELYALLHVNSKGQVAEYPHQRLVPSKKFFVLPSQSLENVFYVDDVPHVLKVPAEFNMIKLFQDDLNFNQMLQDARSDKSLIKMTPNGPAISLQRKVEKGDSILNFDIKTGDMLFVDRFSYHFKRPEVGDPFVFRTQNIEGLKSRDGKPDEKYYIKRLVGAEGDVLEVRGPTLYRNGEPNEGAGAFEANASQEGEYEGYQARGWLAPGRSDTITDGYFYAMGDNSDESHDSRTWASNLTSPQNFPSAYYAKQKGEPVNFVPEKEVVGKALFVFYPLTSRWGVAK